MSKRLWAAVLSFILLIGGLVMAFPMEPLSLRTELMIDGQYTDVTSDVRGSAAINITRGRKNEQGRVSPTQCSVTFNDRTGKYNNRNPTSPYYGKIGRNVLMRQSVVWAEDDFEGRTVSGGLGTSADGHTYTTSGGAAGDYDVTGGKQTVEITSVNVARNWYVTGLAVKQPMVKAVFKPGVVASGAGIQMSTLLHVVDASNFLQAVLNFNTSGTIDLIVAQRVSGVATSIGQSTAAMTYDATSEVGVEGYIDGNTLVIRAWDIDDPTNAGEAQGQVTDASLIDITGSAGVRVVALTGNTNGTFTAEIDDFLVTSPRCVVEVPEKTRSRDTSGTDKTVTFTGSGIMRRLGQGTKPEQSAFRRNILSKEWTGLLAYWPGEDDYSSNVVGSAVPGVEPMEVIQAADDDVVFADSGSVFIQNFRGQGFGASIEPGTNPIANYGGGGRAIGRVPAGTSSPAKWAVIVTAKTNAISLGSDIVILEWLTPVGTYRRWELVHVGTGFGGIEVRAYDSAGAMTVVLSTPDNEVFYEEYKVEAEQTGADVRLRLDFGGSVADTATVVGGSTGRVTQVEKNPNGTTHASGIYIGHLSVWDNAWDTLSWPTMGYPNKSATTQYLDADGTVIYPFFGHLNERVADRLDRLCEESGIPFELVGDRTDTPRMGPQESDELLNLLFNTGNVDGGILYESKYRFGLVYRTRTSLYNQTGVALDHASNHLSSDPRPIEDDNNITNAFIAKRLNGSSYRYALESGPMSVLDFENGGVGTYEKEDTYNFALDAPLKGRAEFQVHLGTRDEERYTGLDVNMARAPFVASSSLVQDVINTDIGDYLSVANPPDDWAPDTIRQLAQGYRESITNDESSRGWSFIFNTTPAVGYDVFTLDDNTLGRLETGGSTNTSSFVAGTDTSMSVTVSGTALWSTTDVPFDIVVSGVRLTVTAVTGAASPQTFTITQTPVNGVTKTIPAGSTIKTYGTGVLAL